MRLPEFILRNVEAILVEWESFASPNYPRAVSGFSPHFWLLGEFCRRRMGMPMGLRR